MFEHPQLAALRSILDTGSFEAAADQLGVTPSAVSQRIRALEIKLGGPVLTRAMPITATDLGATIVAHAHDLARLNAGLESELGAPSSLLISIAVNADSLATWFLPALCDQGPLRFDVQVVDQAHSDRDLAQGKVAAAVTMRADPVAGADVVALGALRYVATATPDFVRHHFPDGLTRDAFALAPALIFSDKDSLQSDWASTVVNQKVVLPSHRLPSTRGFVDAAVLGLGWGLNPLPLVKEHLSAGRLVDLAPHAPHDTPLFWQSSRIGRSVLAPLTRSVRRAAQEVLLQPVRDAGAR